VQIEQCERHLSDQRKLFSEADIALLQDEIRFVLNWPALFCRYADQFSDIVAEVRLRRDELRANAGTH
jgi:hypothetical protein